MKLLQRKPVICCLIFFALGISIISCHTDPNPQIAQEAIKFNIPDNWPQPHYNFSSNPLTKEGFELGKKLFYDARLSRDYSTSCGSCHQAFSAFAQIGHDISHGVEERTGNRNSPPLFNLAWNTSFFWDGGVNNLEVQPLGPILNPFEMDMSIDSVIARLKKDGEYLNMFKAAYGVSEVTEYAILKSLAQFMGVMVSSNSKYDKVMRGERNYSFTSTELAGKAIFEQKCATCHTPPLFTDNSFRNNGLPASRYNDSGRYIITRDPNDLYKFKVPSLRNLGFTPPYMHDGSFYNLDDVIDHYNSGISNAPNVDPLVQGGLNISIDSRKQLLAFLATLNDTTFTEDKRFAE